MILNSNEKIIFLRKKYKITQKELCKNLLSCSNLSYIEKGKINLSNKKAEIITDNFNSIFEKRSIEKQISKDWLLETVDSQISKEIDNLIKNLYFLNDPSELIKKTEDIFLKFSSPENKIKLLFVLGNFNYKSKNYLKAKYYYENLLEIALQFTKYKIFSISLLFLLRINFYINKHFDSKVLYHNYYSKIKTPSKELEGMIVYNFALAFQFLSQYGLAIELYSKVSDYTIKESILSNTEINTSICLQEIKEYESAINILRRLIFKTSNSYLKMKALCNIVSCSRKKNDLVLCKTTIIKLEKVIKNFNDTDLLQVYYTLGLGYLYLEDYKLAINSFESEIKLGIKLTNINFDPNKYLESIKYLLILYKKQNLNKIIELKKIILKIPQELLSLDFVLFTIKSFDDLLLRNETTELINKFHIKIKESKL